MKMSEMRRKYLLNVLAFVCLLGTVVGCYIVFVAVNAPDRPKVEEGHGITATTRMGTFYVTPDVLEVCGRAPDPRTWHFHTEDGTIDQEKVVGFSTILTEWDECVTQYAAILQGFAVGLTTVRDLTMEAAGNYFLEFVPEAAPEMSEEVPVPNFEEGDFPDLEEQPGTFQCETCHT